MKVRIYKPIKSPTQSGKANLRKWYVEPIETQKTRSIDPVMYWVSTNNAALSQLHFSFENKEDAIKFAQNSGYDYVVEEPQAEKFKAKSYASNFAAD